MKGAVAAGHPLTAQAGARILAEGGNAVDACIAAAFVSWVAESPLTGPGGGGFMLVHEARDRADRLLDFFAAVPGEGLPPGERGRDGLRRHPFRRAHDSVLPYRPRRVAVPGMPAGLAAAHRRFARLPWQRAGRSRRSRWRGAGVPLNAGAGLPPRDPRRHPPRPSPRAASVYGGDSPLGEGERLVMNDLAATLEWLAAEGVEILLPRGARRAHVRSRAGAGRHRHRGRPRQLPRHPPPPGAGGLPDASSCPTRRLPRVASSSPSRSGSSTGSGPCRPPGAPRRSRPWPRPCAKRRGSAAPASSPISTGAAPPGASWPTRGSTRPPRGAHTASGAGAPSRSGGRRRRTSASSTARATLRRSRPPPAAARGSSSRAPGIQLNNMLGEPDLNPPGRSPRPGTRLTSMMAPSLVLAEGRPRLVVGSAGSIRLRAAILQIVVNVLDHGQSAEQAIERRASTSTSDVLQLEGGIAPATADAAGGSPGTRSTAGAAATSTSAAPRGRVRADGRLEAAGDPRRGGAGVVVDA